MSEISKIRHPCLTIIPNVKHFLKSILISTKYNESKVPIFNFIQKNPNFRFFINLKLEFFLYESILF